MLAVIVCCLLFAPPFALSLLLLVHSLHAHNFSLCALRLHLLRSAARLHLSSTDASSSDSVQLQQLSSPSAAPLSVLKDAALLLPPHRQRAAQLQRAAAEEKRTLQERRRQQAADTGAATGDGLETAALRVSLLPLLSASLLLLCLTPVALLLSCCAALSHLGHPAAAASAVLLSLSASCCWLAMGHWRQRQWLCSSAVRGLLLAALCCLLCLQLLVGFVSSSSSASFFALSLHFLSLHLLLDSETRAEALKEETTQLQPFLSLTQRQDTEQEDARAAVEARRRRSRRRQRVLHLLHLHSDSEQEAAPEEAREDGRRHRAVRLHADAGEEEEEKQEEEEAEQEAGAEGRRLAPARLVELPSHSHSFSSHIRSHQLRARLRHRSRGRLRLLLLRSAALLTLLAYSLTVALITAPPAASSLGFDGRWLGLLVSLSVLFFDLLLSLLAASVPPALLLSLPLLTRLVLISCDAESWTLGFALLFLLYSLLMAELIAAYHLPGRASSQQPMRLSCFLSSPPTDFSALPPFARPLLLSTLTTGSSSHSVSLPGLCLACLCCLYLMALTVSFACSPPPLGSWQQYQLGLLALLIAATAAAGLVTARALRLSGFRLQGRTAALAALTELLFSGCGLLLWAETGALLWLLLCSLLPAFALSLLSAFSLSVAGLPHSRSLRCLLAAFACLLLLCALGLSASELLSPGYIGWCLVLCLLIAVSGAMPLLKFALTLSMDGEDELCILCCLALLACLLSLLAVQLQLGLLQSLLLAAGGAGWPVLLLLAAAALDWSRHRRPSALSAFAVAAGYLWLLAAAGLCFLGLDAAVGAAATAAACLCVLLSALFLCWLCNGYRLPRPLQAVLSLALAAVLAAGVALAACLALLDSASVSAAFWCASGSWLLLVFCLLTLSLSSHWAALAAGSAAVHFSESVLPVHLLELGSSRLSRLQRPLALLLLAALLLVLWSLVLAALQSAQLGLCLCTACLLLLCLLLRHLSLRASHRLLPLTPLLDERSLAAVRQEAWSRQARGWEGDEDGQRMVADMEAGRDVKADCRGEQRLRRRQLALSPLSSRPACEALDADWLLLRLAEAEASSLRVSVLLSELQCRASLLLVQEAETRRREDESRFALFCHWLQRVKGQLLSPSLRAEESWGWSDSRRRDMRLWLDEFSKARLCRAEQQTEHAALQRVAAGRRQQLATFSHALLAGKDEAAEQQTADPYGGLSSTAARGSAAPPPRSSLQLQKDKLRRQHSIAAGRHKAGSSTPGWQREQRRPPIRSQHKEQEEEKEEQQAARSAKQPSDQLNQEEERKEGTEAVELRAGGQEEQESGEEQRGGEAPPAEARPAAQSDAADSESEQPHLPPAPSPSSSGPLCAPLLLRDHEEAFRLFSAIQLEFERTGQKWTDSSFPAHPSSIYTDGVRDASRPSAVHQAPVDGWKRPEEVLQLGRDAAGAQPGQVASVSLCGPGFRCSDVIQGNIGTCYLLSALAVMALHRSDPPAASAPSSAAAQPQPLLSSLLPLLTTTPAHPSGCYLVCLYPRASPLLRAGGRPAARRAQRQPRLQPLQG